MIYTLSRSEEAPGRDIECLHREVDFQVKNNIYELLVY